MTGAVTELFVGASILFPEGPRLVVGVQPLSYAVRDVTGAVSEVSWRDISLARSIGDGYVDAVCESAVAGWEGLNRDAKQQALDRLEVVLTILTGYARGHASLAREGEPFTPFDPATRGSLDERIHAMARQLAAEWSVDRRAAREREEGTGASGARLGPVAPRTLWGWVRAYQQDPNGGLYALVDGRRRRRHLAFDTLDPEIRRLADAQLRTLDGSRSVLGIDELYRRTMLALRAEGLGELTVPEKTLRGYLSHGLKEVGKTTRSQTTNRLRGASTFTSYPALRPGQVVAIDVTRADNLVWDPWAQKVLSVEIITALDVATRVVLAVRVLPRSANSFEAGLILYDVLRPFSMAVSADAVGDWRWAGVPERLGLIGDAVIEAEQMSGRPVMGMTTPFGPTVMV